MATVPNNVEHSEAVKVEAAIQAICAAHKISREKARVEFFLNSQDQPCYKVELTLTSGNKNVCVKSEIKVVKTPPQTH